MWCDSLAQMAARHSTASIWTSRAYTTSPPLRATVLPPWERCSQRSTSPVSKPGWAGLIAARERSRAASLFIHHDERIANNHAYLDRGDSMHRLFIIALVGAVSLTTRSLS